MKVLAEVVVVGAALVAVAQCGPVIVTEGGRIEGKLEKSINGRKFHGFYSIPYARPPIGTDRFKDPAPPFKWHRLANATKMPPPCMQVTFFSVVMRKWPNLEDMPGSENCLYLNVFTPVTSPTPDKKLPVMVWLHGGGFFSGAAEEYLPHTYLDYDVVMVVVQYRLGVLGFLSTEDSVMPGNLGLKDQTMALQWVQRNIHRFGGDNTRVTIFGESAGGASVHYQMLTPKAKGLFSQAIMQSGTALSPWALYDRHRETAEAIGSSLNCEDVKNSTALLACFHKASARELAAALRLTFELYMLPLALVPRVDGDYMPDLPARLMVEKQYSEVDLLAGVVREEAALQVLALFSDALNLAASTRENFNVNDPISLGVQNEEDPLSLARKIFGHYMDDFNLVEANSNKLEKLLSDTYFNLHHDEVTKHHAAHFPGRRTFRYQLDYRGKHSIGDGFNSTMNSDWVSHADDLIYLFAGGTLLGPMIPKGLTDAEDIRMREKMLKLWTNFATFGNPTPDDSLGFKWEPSTEDNLHYLSLTPSPSMQPDNRKEAREFVASLPLRNSKILYPDKQQQKQQHEQQQKPQTHGGHPRLEEL